MSLACREEHIDKQEGCGIPGGTKDGNADSDSDSDGGVGVGRDLHQRVRPRGQITNC